MINTSNGGIWGHLSHRPGLSQAGIVSFVDCSSDTSKKGSRYDHETYLVCNISSITVSPAQCNTLGLDVLFVFDPCLLLGWRHMRKEQWYQPLMRSSWAELWIDNWFCCALLPPQLVVASAECYDTKFSFRILIHLLESSDDRVKISRRR